MTRDMTERKRAEQALRESEARFRSYFELGLIGMAMTSPAKGVIEVNDELCRILGYSRDELLQKSWPEMTHPDDLAADVAQFNRVIAGELDGYTLDKRWIRKDGQLINSIMAAKCLRKADGSVDYFVGLVLDTSERKQAEAKLKRSEANLAEGQRISHTGSWTWSAISGEIFSSRELLRIFGLDVRSASPTHESFLAIIHPEDRERIRKAFDEAAHTRSDYEAEYRIVRADGSIRHIQNLARPVFDGSGALAEYVGTAMDITERKRAEGELQKLQTELAHVTRLTAIGEMAASIAHEINQPLGAIVNNSNVALRMSGRPRAPTELFSILTDIVRDAGRASDIIARIRVMSRHVMPEKASLEVREVVGGVLALARTELLERGIEAVTDLSPSLPRIFGDRVQLQQVLLNLVMNGIEAMTGLEEERRRLAIHGRHYELDAKPAVLIAVQDWGSGFRREDAEKLFEAFYTTKPKGLGMGLRISRSIVEAHGGRLWAAPNEGPGATFSCVLPVAHLIH
jgi:PAS domain S-box-containing protein